MSIDYDLYSALDDNYMVKIISSSELINAVKKKQDEYLARLIRNKKPIPQTKPLITTVSTFEPSLDIKITPTSLFHSISEITTPVMPNRVALDINWAISRYFWAFKLNKRSKSKQLCLSEDARKIDFHQKAILSDEFGVGMSNLIVQNYLGMKKFLDMSQALGVSSFEISKTGDKLPDYFYYDYGKKSAFIVECKGTQSSKNTTLDQLRKGAEQIQAIESKAFNKVTSVVIATCLLPECTEVYIIDSPYEKDVGYSNNDKSDKTKRVGSYVWQVTNEDKFLYDAESYSRARLLAYAGARVEASNQIDKGKRFKNVFSESTKDLINIENECGNFIGQRITIPNVDGGKIEISKGLLRGLKDDYTMMKYDNEGYYLSNLRDRITKVSAKKYNKKDEYTRTDSGFYSDKQVINGKTSFSSVSQDGTVFEIRLIE